MTSECLYRLKHWRTTRTRGIIWKDPKGISWTGVCSLLARRVEHSSTVPLCFGEMTHIYEHRKHVAFPCQTEMAACSPIQNLCMHSVVSIVSTCDKLRCLQTRLCKGHCPIATLLSGFKCSLQVASDSLECEPNIIFLFQIHGPCRGEIIWTGPAKSKLGSCCLWPSPRSVAKPDWFRKFDPL